jgi:hypothetical protein
MSLTISNWFAEGIAEWQKRRGELSCEISPLTFRFPKIRFGARITATRHSRLVRDLRAEPAVSRTVPSSHSLQELSCAARSSRFPDRFASPVAGSRRVPFLFPLRVAFPQRYKYSLAVSQFTYGEEWKILRRSYEFWRREKDRYTTWRVHVYSGVPYGNCSLEFL